MVEVFGSDKQKNVGVINMNFVKKMVFHLAFKWLPYYGFKCGDKYLVRMSKEFREWVYPKAYEEFSYSKQKEV
jgi:hypothetical protein